MMLKIIRFRKHLTKHSPTLGLFLFVGLFILGCSSQADLSEGDQAPLFTLPSSEGAEVSFEEINDGQATLLYFHMALG